ncbi:MAG: YbhB/YbcL family Raf kinase inhibitor-like protein [Comamonadaceae bacterium]|nr:YbhB/YbcL family Raf kinase inhibitor-like protein [Comamonadaceae bacterium]
MFARIAALSITLLGAGIACAQSAPGAFSISSESIVDGKIAKAHACARQGGENKSPHIGISNTPEGAKYLAVIIDDPDAVPVAGKVWVHWNVFNVPAATTAIAAGTPPDGEVKNSSRSAGYEGMCPPNGVHTYRIAVFAMKDRIDAGGFFGISPITMEKFEEKFKDVIADKALLAGQF